MSGRWVAGVAATLVAASTVLAILISTTGGSHLRAVIRSGAIVIDPITHRVRREIAFSRFAAGGVVAFGSRWINDDAGVIQLDPGTGATRHVIRLPGGGAASVVAAGGFLWATPADLSDASVYRLDPRTRRIRRFGVPRDAFGNLFAGAGFVWDMGFDAMTRIDPATGAVVGQVPVHPLQPANNAGVVTFGFGSVWVVDGSERAVGSPDPGALYRIDPRTDRIAVIIAVPDSHRGPHSYDEVTAGGGAIWVADGTQGVLWRVDPVTNAATRLVDRVPGGIDSIAVGTGGIWVVNRALDLFQLSLDGRIVWSYRLAAHPQWIGLNGGRLWVTYGIGHVKGH